MNSNAHVPAGFAPVNDPNELAAIEGGINWDKIWEGIKTVGNGLLGIFHGIFD